MGHVGLGFEPMIPTPKAGAGAGRGATATKWAGGSPKGASKARTSVNRVSFAKNFLIGMGMRQNVGNPKIADSWLVLP